jgi:hypothetical protein
MPGYRYDALTVFGVCICWCGYMIHGCSDAFEFALLNSGRL